MARPSQIERIIIAADPAGTEAEGVNGSAVACG